MKTKNLFTVILAILAVGCISAQNSRTVKKTINVGNFTSICASSGWDVIVKQGDRQSVSIEVSEKIADYAVIEVKKGTLYISTKSNNRKFWNILNSNRQIIRKAYVTVTDLRELQTSGGVDIIFETPIKTGDFRVTMSGGSDMKNLSLSCNSFKGVFSGGCDAKVRFSSVENITVNASGGSDVELYDINAEQCDITVSGGCDAELSGKTQQLTLIASGGSDISAEGLVAQFCDASFSGAADGKINVTDSLDITISGASDVICFGNPRDVKKSVHRSSTLKIRNN